MNKNRISEILDGIDEKYIDEAADYAGQDIKPAFLNGIKWRSLAACMVLIIAVSLTGIVFVTEAKEYKAAIAFFDENGLSADGLSRSDIKEVYRDISTQRFTYDKTADVIKNVVSGIEIQQDEPTPEELKTAWNRNVWLNNNSKLKTGVNYRIEYKRNDDNEDILEKSIVECYKDGRILWKTDVPNYFVSDCTATSIGTAAWGYDEEHFFLIYWIALFNDKGEKLWECWLDYYDFKHEEIAAVLDNNDGTLAVIGRGNFDYLYLSKFDADGNEIYFKKTYIGETGVWRAARFGDGYLVQLTRLMIGENARLARLDSDGNIIDNFAYEGDDCSYYLADMAEYAGQIYISAYAVPKKGALIGHGEIEKVLDDYVFTKKNGDIPAEELTPAVRDNYTAVLLVCDPNSGNPKAFYSVEGSLGGGLKVNESNQLEWDVESIVSTFSSPATNSFSIGGTCQVYRYTFNTSGTLLKQIKTGETTGFRR